MAQLLSHKPSRNATPSPSTAATAAPRRSRPRPLGTHGGVAAGRRRWPHGHLELHALGAVVCVRADEEEVPGFVQVEGEVAGKVVGEERQVAGAAARGLGAVAEGAVVVVGLGYLEHSVLPRDNERCTAQHSAPGQARVQSSKKPSKGE